MSNPLVQFDGSNFYKTFKKILPKVHLTTFDYRGLARFLSHTKTDHVIYYVGEVKKYPDNKKSQILYSSQQKLFTHLRKQGVEIKLGYLLKTDNIYHEKGVDVQMAVDMVRRAIKKEYHTCYLISSDTDLLPAIQTAKDEGRKIIYVGFEHFISRALLKNCSAYRILKKEDLLRFSGKKK
ncbi:MAG TPA: NYN domain-containing protein [Patescibacteria group bacterium]|nr:NYN domain-containing protein [Patescibacteria group bacterium]